MNGHKTMEKIANVRWLGLPRGCPLALYHGIPRILTTFISVLLFLLAYRSQDNGLVNAQKTTSIDVDPNSSDSLVKGMTELVKDITSEYVKDNSTGYATLGGFLEQNGVSWFGSAIIWGAVYQFSLQTGVSKYDKVAEAALKLAAHNNEGSLLGKPAAESISETLEGKWNDDIGWWMRAFIIGSKKYGCYKTTTGNVTYCKVAKQTFEQITDPKQMDASKCGPGIYWSRNRKAAQGAYYKSTITNTIAVGAGAYLYSKSGYESFLKTAMEIENWLMTSGLVDSEYKVFDGLDASLSCTVLNTTLWSYNSGTLISAIVELINARVNVPEYEKALDKLLTTSLNTFTDQKGLPLERGCRGKEHPSKCNRDVSSYISVFIVSLSEAYHVTKNEEIKKKIAALVDAGLNEHLKSCSTEGCAAFLDLKPLGEGNKFNAYNNLSTLSFLLAKHSIMSRGGPPVILDPNANKPRRSSAVITATHTSSLLYYLVVIIAPIILLSL